MCNRWAIIVFYRATVCATNDSKHVYYSTSVCNLCTVIVYYCAHYVCNQWRRKKLLCNCLCYHWGKLYNCLCNQIGWNTYFCKTAYTRACVFLPIAATVLLQCVWHQWCSKWRDLVAIFAYHNIGGQTDCNHESVLYMFRCLTPTPCLITHDEYLNITK